MHTDLTRSQRPAAGQFLSDFGSGVKETRRPVANDIYPEVSVAYSLSVYISRKMQGLLSER